MHMNKEQFLQLLQEQQSSGLNIQGYCEQHSIPVSTFFYWRRKYASNLLGGTDSLSLLPINFDKEHSITSSSTSGVSIHLPNGIDVAFSASDDKVALQLLNTICTRYV